MNKDYTHISVVLDRSGSMSGIADDMVGGLNSFIDEQKKLPGKATISLTKFDDRIDEVFNFDDLKLVRKINRDDLNPRGGTALYDAVAQVIHRTGARLKNMAEEVRPLVVIVLVITDGHENSSKEYNASSLKALVDQQRDIYKWQFVFLGSNQDAVLEGKKLGAVGSQSLSYASNSSGVAAVMCSTSNLISMTRGAASDKGYIVEQVFEAHDREAAQGKYGSSKETPKVTA